MKLKIPTYLGEFQPNGRGKSPNTQNLYEFHSPPKQPPPPQKTIEINNLIYQNTD